MLPINRYKCVYTTIGSRPDECLLMLPSEHSIDVLVQDASCSGEKAFDILMPILYDRLTNLATECLESIHCNQMLHPADLVHEVYIKLVVTPIIWRDKLQFYTIAARMMRQILVDDARLRKRQKHGGHMERVSIDSVSFAKNTDSSAADDIGLALDRLAQKHPRKAQIVKLVYFGGLTYDEVSSALAVSSTTVEREIRLTKAWLRNELCATSRS